VLRAFGLGGSEPDSASARLFRRLDELPYGLDDRLQLMVVRANPRSLRNARTTKMLTCTARRLLRTVAAMMAPCSVKAPL